MEAMTKKPAAPIERAARASPGPGKLVKHFRQIVLWPLQLIELREGAQIQNHWQFLAQPGPDNPWRELEDEFGDPDEFQERHYSEFVAFLPQVQRFLYGQGLGSRVRTSYGDSPMKVFRRRDVAQVRMTFAADRAPVRFDVAHVDLCFFYDSPALMLALEIYADDLPLEIAQDITFRFGRAYPASWDEHGQAHNCLWRAEWLSADGTVLAGSDYERREKYLAFVCRHRAPTIASHWAFLFRPLVLHHTDEKGPIRFRQIEYYRMPILAYFAMDDMSALTRADFVRLALATGPGDPDTLPYASGYLEDFEARYCYDRYREESLGRSPTRFMCCGHAFVIVGSHRDPFFTDKERGLLGQFRHQYFLLGLIAHFHKAALLMLSDQLVVAVSRLDITRPESIRAFRRDVRQTFEIFLRFTHRYWFHKVSDQVQMRDLFAMWRRHLDTDDLYNEVRNELQDMTHYLDSDVFRRHSNTMLRLTVVTILGLIGTITTGFLGMNVIDEGGAPPGMKLLYFMLVFIPTLAITVYTVMKSRRLSELLDSLSDERTSTRARFDALAAVWRNGGPKRGAADTADAASAHTGSPEVGSPRGSATATRD